MRILLTGISGFVASHLAERLLADGHTVVGLDRGRNQSNLWAVLNHPGLHLAHADLCSADLLDYLEGAEAVIHCAARAGMGPSWSEFPSYMQANVLGTQRLLEAACEYGVKRLVYLSSSSVYGRVADGTEDAPLCPCNPYGASKAAGELLCRAYHERYGLPVTIVRPFSVYGPRQRPDMAHHLFISALLEGRPITVDGDGEQSRSNTYVLDLVDGIVRALHLPGPWQVFNLGGDHSVSINELVRLCEEATGLKAEVRHGPAKPGDQRRTEADYRRARILLDWQPATTLEEGLRAQVAWHRGLVKCA